MKPTTAEIVARLKEQAKRERRRAQEMYKREDAYECKNNAAALEEAAARLERGEGTPWVKTSDRVPVIPEGEDYVQVTVKRNGQLPEPAYYLLPWDEKHGKPGWGGGTPDYWLDESLCPWAAPEPPAAPDPGRQETAWPLRDVVAALMDATVHLLTTHDCDSDGYERWKAAADAARVWLGRDQPGIDPAPSAPPETQTVGMSAETRESIERGLKQAGTVDRGSFAAYAPPEEPWLTMTRARVKYGNEHGIGHENSLVIAHDRADLLAYADRLREELRQAREERHAIADARDKLIEEAAALRSRCGRLTDALREAADSMYGLEGTVWDEKTKRWRALAEEAQP